MFSQRWAATADIIHAFEAAREAADATRQPPQDPPMGITFEEYADGAASTAIYPGAGTPRGLTYSVLGLNGEAGEVAEKVKKAIRDHGGHITRERRAAIADELGDVLWYVANAARDAGLSLSDIAKGNLAKLRDRQERGVLGGSGDNR